MNSDPIPKFLVRIDVVDYENPTYLPANTPGEVDKILENFWNDAEMDGSGDIMFSSVVYEVQGSEPPTIMGEQ
jgi:hypothetical protein